MTYQTDFSCRSVMEKANRVSFPFVSSSKKRVKFPDMTSHIPKSTLKRRIVQPQFIYSVISN